jgi:hypothetical protein
MCHSTAQRILATTLLTVHTLLLNLTYHICHVETTARVLAGRLAHKRHRVAAEKGDQLGD